MRFGSLFSGIEAASAAWLPLGWSCAWVAEIDPFARAVLAHHYPNVPNLGDVNRIDPDAVEPVDLVVFGSPCQSFSVAGKRLGLDDPRGNMALVGLRLIGRIRPRWVVWENVPGVLSSDQGRDFGAFLGLLGELGYGFAYRVLDAQHAGVPQRRRRVFVVGCLGDWRGAAAVLFEPESLRGDLAPRREAGENAPAGAGDGSAYSCRPNAHDAAWRGDGADNFVADIARCVATGSNAQRYDYETETPVAFQANAGRDFTAGEDRSPPLRSEGIGGTSGVAIAYDVTGVLATSGGRETEIHTALRSRAPGHSEGSTTIVIAYGLDCENLGDGGNIGWHDAIEPSITLNTGGNIGVAHALRADGFDASEDGTGRGTPLVAVQCNGSNVGFDLPSLRRGNGHLTGGGPAVAYGIRSDAARSGEALTPSPDAEGRVRLRDPGFNVYEQTAPTLDRTTHAVGSAMSVRRLLPVETERLQGFPDGYTDVPYRGKPAADGNRYRAIGNSMAVPVVAWLGRRIQQFTEQEATDAE